MIPKTLVTILSVIFIPNLQCCDLEGLFVSRKISIEDSVSVSDIIFKGVFVVSSSNLSVLRTGSFTANFEVLYTYKGAELLNKWKGFIKYYR